MLFVGVLLIAFGVLYLVKPDIYRRWIWKRTDVLQRVLEPAQYMVAMRVTGAVFVVVGAILVFVAKR